MVTSTNVVSQPIHNPQPEPWNVLLQRVSKCSRKRQAIKKTVQSHRSGATILEDITAVM